MTLEQLEALKTRFRNHPIIVGEQDQDVWETSGRPYVMIKLQTLGKHEGWVDQGYGHDCLWDGKDWHIAKHGVFLADVIFVTDYHGYTEGAIFARATP